VPPTDPTVPRPVQAVLERLWSNGHAAYVVGGSLRDALLDREATDWDIATDAPPERTRDLFGGSQYENPFGTVLVPLDPWDQGQERVAGGTDHLDAAARRDHRGAPTGSIEVTTFRREFAYGDHRRPDHVIFGTSLEEDLARRDFTVNAIAWGRRSDETRCRLIDPHAGQADLAARTIRAVGDPAQRFGEDALRLLRAVRLAAALDFSIEPGTLAAIRATAPLVGHVSRERVGIEFRRMLTTRPPSRALRLLETTGLLEVRFGLLAAQRGVAQDKVPGHDLWAHTLRTLDAAAELAPGDEVLLLAALLHDAGKPSTLEDGHFPGHDEIGADLAERFLEELAVPRREVEQVADLIRAHMFGYRPEWTDAAVRRFIRRVGPDRMPRLLILREADNLGSGLAADAGDLGELRERVEAERQRGVPLSLADLEVDGHDLMRELDRPPGPWLGRLLERLMESVIADPRRNQRDVLLADARAWTAGQDR
jgi:tRNA nucleotidyltransferase (CCA-adding enzyme)